MSVTLYKDCLKKNVTSILSEPTKEIPPLRKVPIYPKEGTENHYEGSENSTSGNSNGEKDTENVEDKEESSNVNKEDSHSPEKS